jgi:hypothetical protein
VISHCVLLIDQFNLIVSVEIYNLKDPIKIESGIEINCSTMQLECIHNFTHLPDELFKYLH